MATPSSSHQTLQLLSIEELVLGLHDASREDASAYCSELIRRFEPALRRAWYGQSAALEYKDFVQEVFSRFFSRLPHLEDPKAAAGYFVRIAISVAVDLARRQMRDVLDLRERQALHSIGVDDEVLSRLSVQYYLEQLPPREREVLTLEFLEDCSTEEIAQRLGITPGAVRTTKARALRRLRSLIGDEARAIARFTGDR